MLKLNVQKRATAFQYGLLMIAVLIACSVAHAQVAPPPDDFATKLHDLNERLAEHSNAKDDTSSAGLQDYRIGTEDLLDISVFEVPELNRTVRVSAAGEISLPLIGTVHVAGQSPIDVERSLTDILRQRYIKDPQVTIFVREFHSDPVSVVGAVKNPGLYQIQTHKTLVEVLAMAQGLSEGPSRLPGRDIFISRKVRGTNNSGSPNGAPAAVPGTSEGEQQDNPEIVDVPIKEFMNSGDPKWNIPIYPGDVVKVVPAGTVYVAGEVLKPGGFPLTDFDNVSVIQAVTMAGGPLRTAHRKNSVIIRRDAAGNRIEQKVDLARVLKGQDPDVMLGANDILFVPSSVGKTAALRALESSIQMATGMLIYNRPF